MSLLAPAALALAVLLPLIVLLYLLKLRRTERPVSSTYLWRQMVRDVEANAPWQRLRFNILMMLQLIFMTLLIFALARPSTTSEGIAARNAIFIMDTSASMAATDISPTRLEAAKDQAHRWVDDMPDGANLTLIAAGSSARVIVSQTTDPRQMHQAIDSLQPQPGGADLAVALQLASAIASRQPDARVIVLSDGGVNLPDRINVQAPVEYLPIGLEAENQAVSLLNIEAAADGKLTAFAQVTNYGEDSARRRIVFSADDVLIDSFDVDLPPGSSQAVIAENITSEAKVVEARLVADPAVPDFLAWDDYAAVVFQPSEPVSVTLVSPGNLFLETALSVMPSVEVTRLNPGSLVDYPAADVTIFDGARPPTATFPAGNMLFIGPLAGTEFFTITGQLPAPRPLPASADDPLLRFVDLSTVSILDAARISLPDWAAPAIYAEDPTVPIRAQPPLLFSGEPDNRRVAVIAFDLRRTDLTLQNAFPLMLLNLMDWLAPGRSGVLPQSVAPGETLIYTLPSDSEATAAVITRPDSSSTTLPVSDNRMTIGETGQLGVYRLDFGEGEPARMYAVNLFSPQDSAIAPADQLLIQSNASVNSAGADEPANREWWRFIAFLALLLLCAEWLVYHRPALSRIFQRT